eukprot:356868-Chlamydomonas_euryale.AAC.8
MNQLIVRQTRAIHALMVCCAASAAMPNVLHGQCVCDVAAVTSVTLAARRGMQDEAVEDLERNPSAEMKRMVFSLELKRIRYLLRLYLRTRLHKIERMAAYVLGREEALSRLSDAEKVYLQEYFVMVGKHLNTSVLDNMPEGFKELLKSHLIEETDDLVSAPVLDTHVFCSILKDVGSVTLDE